MKTRYLVCSSLLFILSLTLVLGCESKRTAASTVSGTVMYNGNPVTGGRLAFHTKEGVYSAGIGADGTFSAAELPEGELIVTIDNEYLNPERKQPVYDAKTAGGSGGGSKGMYGNKATSPPPPKGAGAAQVSKAGEGTPADNPGTYRKIPQKYTDKTKSPLKVTLHSGAQTVELVLSDD